MRLSRGYAVALCLLTLALAVASRAEATRMYGINEDDASLYEIDLATGQATLIGPMNDPPSIAGLAWDSQNAFLYASDLQIEIGTEGKGDADWGLGTVDPESGATDFLGTHDPSNNVWGLAYDPASDTLYGADNEDLPQLVYVDRTDGTVAPVGGPFAAAGALYICALAFDTATATLYGVDCVIGQPVARGNAKPPAEAPTAPEGGGNALYTIDTTTGAATLVGPLGVYLSNGSLFIGLEVDPETGILYVADDVTQILYTVDTATGEATEVGPMGVPISALAATPGGRVTPLAIPTLSRAGVAALAAALAGLAFVALHRRRARA